MRPSRKPLTSFSATPSTVTKSMWCPDGKSFHCYLKSKRFNVYNTVKVTLNNNEFGQISIKELEVAKFLDLLHTVRIAKEDDDVQVTFDSILGLSNVDHSIESVRNKQSQPTPLCNNNPNILNNVVGETREMLRITQA